MARYKGKLKGKMIYRKKHLAIKKNEFVLTPGRYVGIKEQEDDGEPFEEKMERLTSELGVLFNKSIELQDEIKKQLNSIGFEIKE